MGPDPHGVGSTDRGQGGFALAETLISVTVASIWVLAIVIGLLVVTAVDASSASRQAISTALAGSTEAIKEVPYLPCGASPAPTVGGYTGAVAASPDRYTPPTGITVTITEVEHWDRDQAAFVASCPGSDAGAQRLSVRVVHEDGQSGTAQVVKAAP